MLACPGPKVKEGMVDTRLFISLMKVNRKGIKNNIKPIIQEEFKGHMYKKHYQTICTNGLVTFKICRSIVEQLSKVSDKPQKWDDFEFGPTVDD